MRLLCCGLAIVLALSGPGCSDDTSVTSPTTTTPTSPVTETFAGGLVRLGTASRTITAAKAGTIELTLKSMSPAAYTNVIVGVGIGVPTSVSAGCSLTTAVNTAPGTSPQVTASVDAGTYCVKIFDVGNLTPQQAFFELTIVRP